jgi:ketosteroid isomerase-like protein
MRLVPNARVVARGERIGVFGEALFTTRQGPVRQDMATLLRLRDGPIVQQTLVVRR